jgi:RimJ/RimL family protein N-acetyltransferase
MQSETKRLFLRPLSMDDLTELSRLQSDPEMMRYMGDGKPYTIDQSRGWLEWHVGIWELEGFSLWAAELKPERTFVGWVGITKVYDPPHLLPATEVGWFIDRKLWGRGLATEGAREALAFGFDRLGLDRIIARYNADNVASGRVMEKLGMRRWRDEAHSEIAGAITRIYELLRPPDGATASG